MLDDLRGRLRSLCGLHAVALDVRARLVLAVTALARPAVAAGHPVTLDTQVHVTEHGASTLVLTLHLPMGALTAEDCMDLPLFAERNDPDTAVWRLPVDPYPSQAPGADPTDEEASAEEEMGALIARLDAVEREQRDLKHEMVETNNGVLAMFLQSEERDERLRLANAVISRELENALRPPPLTVDGVELAVYYAPAGADSPTGGDLYDWFLLPDGTLHVTVVDAVGHGVLCTRNALDVTHTVRTLALEGHPLHQLVGRTASILDLAEPDIMATLLLARLTPHTGALRIANGSHPPALLTRANGDTTYLEAPGRGIGFPDPGSPRVRAEDLAEGDLLLLYTDGLTESRRTLREDEHRLTVVARECRSLPTPDVPAAIAAQMHDRVTHLDDTLLLAIR